MNGEVLHCLETSLRSRKVEVEEQLAGFRRLRKMTASHMLTNEELLSAKNEGRE